MRLHMYGFFALVLASQCDYGSSGNNFRTGHQLDYREIARQNKITEQILQNYLEKRLFPNDNRPSKAPTVWDILPRARRKPTSSNNIQDVLNTTQETLESGESERVSFFNDDDDKTKEDEEIEAASSDNTSSIFIKGPQPAVSFFLEPPGPSSKILTSPLQVPPHPTFGPSTPNVERSLAAASSDNTSSNRRISAARRPRKNHFLWRQARSQRHRAKQTRLQQSFTAACVSSMMYRCLLLSASILATLAAAGPSVRSGAQSTDCPNCIDDSLPTANRWTMPLLKLGEKRYYLGIFFKANYFRATQYCRFHGMHLASITSLEENDKLEKYIKDFGLGHEHFWTSGTDLADEGHFFWMSTGRPITFTNWNAGEPNNFQYENGEEENCLELWNRDGKGLKWNDSPCSFETYFVCEVQQ